MDSPIFDDWTLRNENYYRSRCRTYKFLLIFLSISLAFSLVITVLYWYPIIAVLIFGVVLVALYLEWLKTKNHHLRIYEDSICITNRFGKEERYVVDYKSCTLVLKKSFQRSGGIWLLFYDSEKRLICGYEDMINHATYYGGTPTNWETAVMELDMPIIDENCILKNR